MAVSGFQPASETVEVVNAAPYFADIETRFGIPASAFDDYLVLRPNAKCLALVARGLLLPDGLQSLAFGMPFLYVNMRDPRLTTAAAVKFGSLATRNVVDLDDAQTERFVTRHELALTREQEAQLTGPGYVLARHCGMVLGLGHARPGDEAMVLAGTVPSSWRDRLAGGP